jgi:transcriptional regulator GlxA family with amidase domain
MTAQGSTDAPRRIGFLLLPGLSNLCLANAVEPLRAVNQAAGTAGGYAWRLLSLDGGPVETSSGIEIGVDAALAEAAEPGLTRYDAFFVIASYGFEEQATARLKSGLRRAAGQSAVVGGFDTGPWLLAATGLLDGYRATIHWQEQERLRRDFPEVAVEGARYVVDRDRITAGGATTVLDLMLSLIRRDLGDVAALDVMRLFVYDTERAAEGAQQGALQAPFAARAPLVAAAIAAMEQAIEAPEPIARIAEAAGCSQRKLERAFDRALGVTPQRYYQYLRLSAARRLLLESGQSVTEVAEATGFASATSFARAYKRFFGHAPRDARPKAVERPGG